MSIYDISMEGDPILEISYNYDRSISAYANKGEWEDRSFKSYKSRFKRFVAARFANPIIVSPESIGNKSKSKLSLSKQVSNLANKYVLR